MFHSRTTSRSRRPGRRVQRTKTCFFAMAVLLDATTDLRDLLNGFRDYLGLKPPEQAVDLDILEVSFRREPDELIGAS
jgi:hypothetical protein